MMGRNGHIEILKELFPCNIARLTTEDLGGAEWN